MSTHCRVVKYSASVVQVALIGITDRVASSLEGCLKIHLKKGSAYTVKGEDQGKGGGVLKQSGVVREKKTKEEKQRSSLLKQIEMKWSFVSYNTVTIMALNNEAVLLFYLLSSF